MTAEYSVLQDMLLLCVQVSGSIPRPVTQFLNGQDQETPQSYGGMSQKKQALAMPHA